MFFLLQNQRTGGWNRFCRDRGKGIGTSGGGIQLQKGRKMNTVQIMYTHFAFVNAKMIHVETVPGTKGVGIKESCGRGEFKYDVFDTL
jgi:hypothetical protein